MAEPTIIWSNLSWKQLLCKNSDLNTDSIKHLTTCHHSYFQSINETSPLLLLGKVVQSLHQDSRNGSPWG